MYKYLFIFLLLISNASYSQKLDYLEIRRTQYLFDCGVDSQAIFKAFKILQEVNTKNISKNVDYYYHDLGIIYYKMSLITRNKKYMDEAVRMDKRSLKISPDNIFAIFDCAVALVFSNHCKEGMKYLDNYLRLAPQHEVDMEAVAGLRDVCNSRK